jgi:MarR family transcriptional regulator, multiple antibiotic resistance protein MarR
MRSPRLESELDSVFPGRLLLGQVLTVLLQAHDEVLEQFGITSRQGIALMNCARGEANTPVELAMHSALDVSSMSRMLDRLEKKGLIRRSRTREDRRKVIILVTPKGRALLDKATPAAARVAAKAWQGVTERERQTLRDIVRKILGNLGHVSKS